MTIANKKHLITLFLLMIGYVGIAQMDSLCSVTIVEDTTETGIYLRAEVTGTPPFQYEWSGNTQTDSFLTNGTEWHSVTIVDANECVAFAEYDYINRDSSNFLIEGRIRNRGNGRDILFEGAIYLFLQQAEQDFALEDSVAFGAMGEWSPFSFGEVAAGTYILLAELHPDSDGYDDFIPTYYGPTTEWQNARLVQIPYSGTRSADMGMYSKRIADGDGIISGTLTLEDALQGQADSRNQQGLADYQIVLFNETNTAIDYTLTDDAGAFSFENIAFGKYHLAVEKPGYTSAQIPIDLTETIPSIDNFHFIVTLQTKTIEGNLSTATTEQIKIPLTIFPNPSSNTIFIESEEQIFNTLLFDNLGRKVKEERNKKEVDLTALGKGVYWIHIQTEGQIFIDKIIKK